MRSHRGIPLARARWCLRASYFLLYTGAAPDRLRSSNGHPGAALRPCKLAAMRRAPFEMIGKTQAEEPCDDAPFRCEISHELAPPDLPHRARLRLTAPAGAGQPRGLTPGLVLVRNGCAQPFRIRL